LDLGSDGKAEKGECGGEKKVETARRIKRKNGGYFNRLNYNFKRKIFIAKS